MRAAEISVQSLRLARISAFRGADCRVTGGLVSIRGSGFRHGEKTLKLAIHSLFAAAVLTCAASAAAADFYVAFWNVENLFDTVDDPTVEGDEEFTPDAPKKWTEERFDAKLVNLARVIADMNDGHGPDVLGLSEVENRQVVEKLIEHLKPLNRNYAIVHKDSPSGRGIDCALIYDQKLFKLKSSDFLLVHSHTREIVEAELSAGDDSLFVFVNHWPSRGGDKEGKGRIQAAQVLRKRVDEIMAKNASADIVVLGDLNDHPTDPSISKYLNTWGNPDELKPGVLFNSTWAVHSDPKRGTYKYRDNWEVIDHVILSPGMLDKAGFAWKRDSTDVFMRDYQLYKPGTPEAKPNRTYGGDNYYGGFSDHLPVGCVIEHE